MRHIYRLKQLILASLDLGAYLIGLYFALFLRYFSSPDPFIYLSHLPLFTFIFIIWLLINYMSGLYDLTDRAQVRNYPIIAQTALISFAVAILIFYLIPENNLTPKTILLLTVLLGYAFSLILRALFNRLFSRTNLAMPIFFIGENSEMREMIDIVEKNPNMGYRVAAKISSPTTASEWEKITTEAKNIGGYLVVSSALQKNADVQKQLYDLLFTNVHIISHESFYEVLTGRVAPSVFSEDWFLENLGKLDHPFYDHLRRLVDYFFGVILFIIFLITLPFVAILTKLTSRGPIFFVQNRSGLHGKVFKLIKYRSMFALATDGSAETDGVKFAAKNDDRVTVFGKFLRRSRLDELPQCLNLLKGDLTLIGPRPERPEIVQILTEKMPYYSLRHIVKPGITGWAAVRQNYTADLESSLVKLQYDLFYIKNRSWLLDISIILRTINLVVRMLGQ